MMKGEADGEFMALKGFGKGQGFAHKMAEVLTEGVVGSR